MLAIIVVLFLVLIAFGLWGCTARQETTARAAGAAVSTVLGLPPVLGDSIVAGLLLLSHAAAAKMGHKRGRRAVPPPKAAS